MSNSHDDDTAAPNVDMEYPDQAGYPDGTGTLDEGTRRDEAAEDAAEEIDDFAEHDTEDE